MALDTVVFHNSSGQILCTITLDEVECNGNEQSWQYSIDIIPNGLNHFSLELCETADASSDDQGVHIGPPNPGRDYCLTGNQILWGGIGGTSQSEIFTFKLSDKCYKCAKVNIAIRIGNNCYFDKICGPCCTDTCTGCNCPDLPPPVTRGIIFM